MNLLELNKIAEGKYPQSDKEPKESVRRTITEDEFNNFRVLQSIDDAYISGVAQTDSHTEYFTAYPLLDMSVDPEIKEDLFYASKLGFFYEGVPSRLVYILQKAIRKYNTPNNALSAIDSRLLQRYTKQGALPEDVTIKRIMENLIGTNIELLSSFKRKVQFKNIYEIYVENTDRVLIVPGDIADLIDSREDLMSIRYEKDLGVCMYDTPVRILNERIGITVDEYDLRERK